MARILSIETSSQVCSVALHDDGQLVVTQEVNIQHSHASKLASLIDYTLTLADTPSSGLHAVAVSAGPGSYTGLRIGTATAKGLCFSLDIPLISIPTLDILTEQVQHYIQEDAFFCPMIDARRMEVYCQLTSADGQLLLPVEPKIIDEFSFSEWLDRGTIFFFGSGAEKCSNVIHHANARFISMNPTASQMGALAFKRFEKKQVENLIEYEPYYLKDFLAKKSQRTLL